MKHIKQFWYSLLSCAIVSGFFSHYTVAQDSAETQTEQVVKGSCCNSCSKPCCDKCSTCGSNNCCGKTNCCCKKPESI